MLLMTERVLEEEYVMLFINMQKLITNIWKIRNYKNKESSYVKNRVYLIHRPPTTYSLTHQPTDPPTTDQRPTDQPTQSSPTQPVFRSIIYLIKNICLYKFERLQKNSSIL